MKFAVTLVGLLDEHSLMMSVNNCFVNVVFTNRRGSRDRDVFKFSFVVGRCGISWVLSLNGIVVVVVTLLSLLFVVVVGNGTGVDVTIVSVGTGVVVVGVTLVALSHRIFRSKFSYLLLYILVLLYPGGSFIIFFVFKILLISFIFFTANSDSGTISSVLFSSKSSIPKLSVAQ